MIGPAGVAVLLADYFTTNLATLLDRLDDELGPALPAEVAEAGGPGVAGDFDLATAGGLTAGGTDLPPPLSVKPAVIAHAMIDIESVGIDDWPLLVVVVQQLARMTFLELADDGSRIYECTYPTAVFTYARGDGFHSTDAIRMRLVLAVREALLVSATAGDPQFVIDETTLTEAYSDTNIDANLRATIAAARTDIDVKVTEALTPLVAGTGPITGVRADTHAFPPHPALS